MFKWLKIQNRHTILSHQLYYTYLPITIKWKLFEFKPLVVAAAFFLPYIVDRSVQVRYLNEREGNGI